MLTALLLSIWAIFCIYDNLGPGLVYANRPLIAGTVAGLIVHDVTLGMAIGGALEFVALGSYTFGGATTPDWPTGTIIGVALAESIHAPFIQQTSTGITVGLLAATILVPLDPIGRTLTTAWIHRADTAALNARSREITVLQWTAFIPWAAVRAIPTFIVTYFVSGDLVTKLQHALPTWLVDGFTFAGGLLPVVGFAMLLSMLPVARYWYFLLIGFVLYAYLKVPSVGITLFGVAVAIIFVTLKAHGSRSDDAAPPSAPSSGSAQPAVAGEASDV
jgi:mannose/fructose/N-acetylgalactosamine-specific phosphotransferase system component IIC